MLSLGFSTTHFYDFKGLDIGSFEENADGIEKHFESLPYTNVHSDIPSSIVFDRIYKKFPNSKYINITRPADEWALSMQKIALLIDKLNVPYIFEDAYCNFYLKSGKKRIQDLTYDELITIRQMHLDEVDAFFEDKENYLEVELSDPEIGSKICKFMGIESNIQFPSIDVFRAY
jgi:hypothetical protein